MFKRLSVIFFTMFLVISVSSSNTYVFADDVTTVSDGDIISTFTFKDTTDYNKIKGFAEQGIKIEEEYVSVVLLAHPNPGKKSMNVGVAISSYSSVPKTLRVKIIPKRSTTVNGSYIPVQSIELTPPKVLLVADTKKMKLDKTWFWKFDIEVKYSFKGGYSHTENDSSNGFKLVNRMGREYPQIAYPQNPNAMIPMPNSTVIPKVSTAAAEVVRKNFDNSVRSQYRNYWAANYNNGEAPNVAGAFYGGAYKNGGNDWEGWEIHHILPIEFGGTNVYSNFVPLPKQLHKQYTTWFAGYDGVNK